MLVSHRKKFIFTKTIKTAGTSVESFFEKHCMPEGDWRESHARDEYISETGIIGYRGVSKPEATQYYNHMPAYQIRDLVGQSIWQDYFKFSIVRNPFDKMISGFTMFSHSAKNLSRIQKLKTVGRKIIGQADPIHLVKGSNQIEQFRSWVKQGGMVNDRDKYLIENEECVDYFIRFEDIHNGISEVCDQLSIEFDKKQLPNFKKTIRNQEIKNSDFYDRETKKIVEQAFAWEIDKFSYSFPE